MDTHITTAPDIDERIGAPLGSPIRLPGGRGTLPHLEDHDLEPSGEAAGDSGTEEASTSAPREKLVATPKRPARRLRLLSTAAVVAVLAGMGGATWAERHGTLNLPLPPKLVSLLRTGLPATSQVAGEVGVTPNRSPAPAAAAVRPDSELAAQAARQRAEFASLKSGDALAEVGVAASSRPAAPSPSVVSPPSVTALLAPSAPLGTTPTAVVSPPAISADPGTPTNPLPSTAISAAPPASVTPAVAAPTVGVPATPAPVVTVVPAFPPAPKPHDPVQTAVELRAEPLSPKQQVEVVGLVRELGAQLKESRLTVTQMQATVAELKEQLDSRMTEFDGRLGLAEAGTVLAQSRAALPQPAMPAAVPPVHPVAATQRLAPTAAGPAPVSTACRSVKDFRVQGASPGLAVLNVVGAAPGEAPVLYVALGDQVPGIGRIKLIYQRGTTWLVQTDAGLIQ